MSGSGAMMPLCDEVDLLKGFDPAKFNGGIVTFRSGEQFFCMHVAPDDDGEIEVRIESGVYRGYTRDGRPCAIEIIDGRRRWVARKDQTEGARDIVEFI
jgi:hypothetical protein